MSFFTSLSGLGKLTLKKGVLLSIIAALLVPPVYAGILLSPKWGPYDHLSNLPVAVVNSDKGAVSDNEQIHVGNDLVADLKKSKDLGWDFVSKQEANDGLKSQKYYMVIEIPSDFSKKITTVLDPNPQKVQLNYIQNEGLNYTAAQITNTAAEKIREQLANKITEKYTQTMFGKLGDVAAGFKTAADGSSKLYDGTTQLHDGTDQLLSSLIQKSSDINKLADGSKQLNAGTLALLNSLKAKQNDITKLANGSEALKNGTGQMLQSLTAKSNDISALDVGSHDMKNGLGLMLNSINEKSKNISLLAAGAQDLNKGASDLKDGTNLVLDNLKLIKAGNEGVNAGIAKLAPGSQAVSDGVSQLSDGSVQLAAVAAGLKAALDQLAASNAALASDPGFQKIVGTSKVLSDQLSGISAKTAPLKAGAAAVADGLGKISPATQSLATGTAALTDKFEQQVVPGAGKLAAGTALVAGGTADVEKGWNSLSDGVTKLYAGSEKISGGTSAVNEGWKALTQGVTKLDAGAQQISGGNGTVNEGWKALTAGVTKIHAGSDKVSEGNAAVARGWGDLTSGVTKLDNGAQQLNDGSLELANGLKKGADEAGKLKVNDKNISMFASPLETVGKKVNTFPVYTVSTAPYVLSLALFVGILIMSFFFDFKKPVGVAISGFAWFANKFSKWSLLTAAQSFILSLFVLVFLNYQIDNGFMFVLFALFASLAFSTIVFLFVTIAGNVGRFLLLALIVLQLDITGANLPLEMLPENMRALSTYLPFTYSIAGFKSIISFNNSDIAWTNAYVLIAFIAGFSLLAVTASLFIFTKKDEFVEVSA